MTVKNGEKVQKNKRTKISQANKQTKIQKDKK
jgi:hypothetical protein